MRFGIEIAVATLPIRALLALAMAVRQAAPAPEKIAHAAERPVRYSSGIPNSGGNIVSLLSSLLGSKVAIGLLAAGVLGAGGVSVAALADVLPAPVQQGAHDILGAPAPVDGEAADVTASPEPVDTLVPSPAPTDIPIATPTPTPTPDASPGPDATGPAAFGLCNAYSHGGLAPVSTAYGALDRAASSSGSIAAYCAIVHKPSDDTQDQPSTTIPAPAPERDSSQHEHAAKAPSGSSGHGKSGEHHKSAKGD